MNLKVGDSVPAEALGAVAYKKTEEVDEYAARGGARKKKGKAAAAGPNKENVETVEKKLAALTTREDQQEQPQQQHQKKTKFHPLFSKDGKANDVVLLQGRHPCECMAVKHGLVNNCLSCGRIVCEQEGSGPCLFCGKLVCTKAEQEILNRNSRKSEELLKKLAGDSRAQYRDNNALEKAYQQALDNKNRLLEYDITCEKRTKVIDDEADYFSVDSNKWLTPEQRAALEKKREELHAGRHQSRLNRRVNLDFAGRRVVEAEDEINYDMNQDTEMQALFKNDQFSVEGELARRQQEEGGLVNPTITRDRPVFDESLDYGSKLPAKGEQRLAAGPGKVQDGDLQEMSDQGMALSMHQPWASLLVMGIKMHEGRTWYSSHRGRLWIHAASKVPTQQEIEEVVRFYQLQKGMKAHEFPPLYPTSCILGCVDVGEVLPQEEYRELYPDGESTSPYVFICKNPQELLIKFPMSGHHKLFKLDPKIHKAAQKSHKKRPGERGSSVLGL